MRHSMRWMSCVASLGILALAGCSTDRAVVRDDGSIVRAPGSETAGKEETLARADAAMAGVVRESEGERLLVAPYAEDRGEMTFQLDPSVPVYQGGSTITTRALRSGVDARVHYDQGTLGQPPRVVAVEVLTPEEARAERERPQSPAPAAQGAAPENREQVIAQAEGAQPGVVQEVEGNTLILDPYQRAAGEARLEMSRDVPVYQADSVISTRALMPGVDVRVFYRTGGEGQREVVAVEILDPEEAATVRRSVEDLPLHGE